MENIGSIYNLVNFKKNIGIASYYEHYYLAFDMQFHSHQKLEIMYVIFGELTIEYYENDEVCVKKIRPTEFVFIDSDVKHKIIVDNIETRILNIEMFFSSDSTQIGILGNLYDNYPPFKELIKKKKSVFKSKDEGTLIQCITLMQKYLEANEKIECDSKIANMISLLFMLISDCVKNEKQLRVGSSIVNQAIDYIQDNYQSELTLDMVSNACNISKNHLNSLFKDTFQMTVMAYVRKVKITKACELMQKTNLLLSQIRARVGFTNKMSFNRNFEKIMNTSPGKYKSFITKKSRQVNLNTKITNIYNYN